MHLEQNRGRHAQRDGRQQLIGDAEQRPQRIDAAQRIAHALDTGNSPTRRPPPRSTPITPGIQLVRPSGCVHVPQQILQHEAPHARAGIDDGQDEQRLEHDGEVIPEAEHRLRRRRSRAKMCAMPSASDGAPPVRPNSVCSPTLLRQRRHRRPRSPESPSC